MRKTSKSVGTSKKTSRSHLLLVHMLKGRTINGRQALAHFGIYRLSAIIHGFRKRGFVIETKMVKRNGITYGVYRLTDTPQKATS